MFEGCSIYEDGAAFLLLDELQRQMDRPGQLTGYIVQAHPAGDADAIARLRAKIEALDPEVAATPCAEFVHSLAQMRVVRTLATLVSCIAGLLGALGMLNTMAMSVFERRREFGMLRAIGWRRRRIVGLVLLESLVLAAGGAVVGLAIGLSVPTALRALSAHGGARGGRAFASRRWPAGRWRWPRRFSARRCRLINARGFHQPRQCGEHDPLLHVASHARQFAARRKLEAVFQLEPRHDLRFEERFERLGQAARVFIAPGSTRHDANQHFVERCLNHLMLMMATQRCERQHQVGGMFPSTVGEFEMRPRFAFHGSEQRKPAPQGHAPSAQVARSPMS